MSPLTDDFDGSYGAGLSLTITTPGGSPVEVPIQGIKDIDFPDNSFKLDKYTPISGVRAGREQVVICSQESSEIPATLVYEKEHQIAMHDITGINNCAIVLLLADGLTLTGSGGIFRMGIERITDSQHISTQFTFALEAGWTLVDAGDTVFTPEYTVTMSAGAFTIDLTACGSGGAQDLSGNYVSRIRLTNPAANSNPIQVAEGAANGY
ncbi:MAG: hypothetical protein KAS32_09265, partial [Candidatus Peribacteraceae bacterium]|nr:hypothetical protein [Candidatus Peribacteraceae bacterium]